MICDKGLPLLLFAVRETPQESLHFSPCVFGHTVRGPLQFLKESLRVEHNVLDYVSYFRERLHHVCQLARENLVQAQTQMKSHHNKKSVYQTFHPGDKVLVLVPLPGSTVYSLTSQGHMWWRGKSVT